MGVFDLNFNIMKLAGKAVIVYLDHIIYGTQELSISYFEPFQTDERIGFIANGREIYMENHEIERIERDKNLVKIVRSLQTITIELK